MCKAFASLRMTGYLNVRRSSAQLLYGLLDARDAFMDALHRCGVAEADEAIGAERLAGHDRDARFVEKESRERVRIMNAVLAEECTDVRKDIKRAVGFRTATAIDGVDR